MFLWNKNKWLFLFLISLMSILSFGCANIIPPSGGMRDEKPPEIKEISVKDSMVNFSESKITIVFDEAIQLKSPPSAIKIYPQPKKDLKIKSKYKSIDIFFPDSALKANTSYNLTLSGLSDLTEGNENKDFRFVFSTGPYLDSLSIKGHVQRAEDGMADTSLYIVLYENTDSFNIISIQKAPYIIKTNSNGNFEFDFLPEKKFLIFGFSDLNRNGLYDMPTERIAFLDTPIFVSKNLLPLNMFSFAEKISKESSNALSRSKNNVNFGLSFNVDTTLKKPSQDLNSAFLLNYTGSFISLDPTKIILRDTSNNLDIEFTLSQDTLNKQISILPIKPWKENGVYKILIYPKAFKIDSSRYNEKLILNFKTFAVKNYGDLILNFHPLDSTKNYILFIYENDKLIKKIDYLNGVYSYKVNLLKPGTYHLKILQDKNKDNTWNTGNFYSKIQPELIEDLNTPILVKENWLNTFDVKLNKENQNGKIR